MSRTATLAVIVAVLGLATALLAYATRASNGRATVASSPVAIPQPTAAQLEAAYLGKLPVAPESERIDVVAPTFSDSTTITNPLFPISDLHSAVLNGRVDGKPFHTETTLLPETRIIEWAPGERVETLVSQYVAFLDGRIEEVALDYYAQADDGSVWYFGEDVFNYKDGFIADTDGTWIAGKEGPPAMIMPGDPQRGDVYRPENAPGLVFEEVTVKSVGEQVAGPRGLVDGAIIAGELHQDGSRELKTFAPGYGEFFTGSGGDVEALALSVPTDALDRPVPTELDALSAGAGCCVRRDQGGRLEGRLGERAQAERRLGQLSGWARAAADRRRDDLGRHVSRQSSRGAQSGVERDRGHRRLAIRARASASPSASG